METKNKAANYQPIFERKGLDVDPFLTTDSFIIAGTCTAVVCCVGKNSTRGDKVPTLDTKINTPLQNNLWNISGKFSTIGVMMSLAILVNSLLI